MRGSAGAFGFVAPRALLGFALVASLLVSANASADSYSFGGQSGRVSLSVTRSGFNEGAGEGGWSEDSAREFVSWAHRIDSLLPPGASVRVQENAWDDGVIIEIRRSGRRERVQNDLKHADYDPVFALLARRFHAVKPASARAATLYTIQLFASRSKQRADALAARIDAREVRPGHQVFYEACGPCSVPETRVLEANGVFRIIIGVYDRVLPARRAAKEIQRQTGLVGFVRRLTDS